MNLKRGEPRRGHTSLQDMLQQYFGSFEKAMPPNLRDELVIFEKWTQAVGAELSKKTNPKWFRQGTLCVETTSAIFANELQFMSHQIKKKLNALVGRNVVQEIQFRQRRI